MRVALLLALLAATGSLAGCFAASTGPSPASAGEVEPTGPFVPHVIVGVTDTGINPYHDIFARPDLIEHPCTYIRDFPCDVKELRLSLDIEDWDEAFEADRATWEGLEREAWYWIPETVFVAVRCHTFTGGLNGERVERTDICLLDDPTSEATSFPGHGTAVTSQVIMENPDALLAFQEGPLGGVITPFLEAGIPIDIASASYGPWLPRPTPRTGPLECPAKHFREAFPLLVMPTGNTAWPIFVDCNTGHVASIKVGGGATAPRVQYTTANHGGDVTSYYCPPAARRASTHEVLGAGGLCGTSFGTPMVSGALSKVILALRQQSGYDGSLTEDGMIDPVLGISALDLREAMNLTASYAPAPKHADTRSIYASTTVPLNPVAPWLQWGWGFYDGDVANATIAHLLGTQPAPAKPDAATQYMTTTADLRRTLWG